MTRKEFECLRLEIEKQRFESVEECDPMKFAVARAAFKQAQLRKLISLARKVDNSRTVAGKILRWERVMMRLDQVPRRFAEHQKTNGVL